MSSSLAPIDAQQLASREQTLAQLATEIHAEHEAATATEASLFLSRGLVSFLGPFGAVRAVVSVVMAIK